MIEALFTDDLRDLIKATDGREPCYSPPPSSGLVSEDWHSPAPKIQERAAAACRDYACPLLEQCRAYAVRHPQGGVWGGTTEADRGYNPRQSTTIRVREGA